MNRLSRAASSGLAALGVMSVLAISGTASAEQLTDFRAPNDLETAYIGAAARLQEPSLCYRVSTKALYRIRKASLVRSRCFYYVALNTGTLSWCDEVQPIPVGASLMNWLEPERCRLQVRRLRKNANYRVNFDHKLLLTEMGYSPLDVPDQFLHEGKTDWRGFFEYLASHEDRVASSAFVKRLSKLPNFNDVERAEDQTLYFTDKQQDREYYWMLQRSMKLCFQGRGSDNCKPEIYAKMRRQPKDWGNRRGGAVREVGEGETATEFRRPTKLEEAYYEIAVHTRRPNACRKIGGGATAVGWTTEPGLLFMPLRSICLTAVAKLQEDDALCQDVVPLSRDDLDGADLNPQLCRMIVEGRTPSPQRKTLTPNWKSVLTSLGVSEAELDTAVTEGRIETADWGDFGRELLDARRGPLAERLKQLVAGAPDFSTSDNKFDAALFYKENDLQKHLYQLSLTRFHCTVRVKDEALPEQGGSPPPNLTEGAPFALVNHNGQAVTDKDYRGKYLMVYFGYTYCPDVCPTSLQAIIEAMDMLDKDQVDAITPLFITLDARRDTTEQLADYVPLFDDRLIGLTGTPTQIRRVARGYGVYYYVGDVDGEYVVDHTAYIYLIAPDGKYLTYFRHGTTPADMAAEIARQMAQRQAALQ